VLTPSEQIRPRLLALPGGAAGSLGGGEYVLEVVLPFRFGSLAGRLGDEPGTFDELHLVDVPRAVGKDFLGVDADDELRFGSSKSMVAVPLRRMRRWP
jgi:hypothetical protein